MKSIYLIGLMISLPALAGAPGPNDTKGTPLPKADEVVITKPTPLEPRPIPSLRRPGTFKFVHNCDEPTLPDYKPYDPACDSYEDQQTEITTTVSEPEPEPEPQPLPPPVPITPPMHPGD